MQYKLIDALKYRDEVMSELMKKMNAAYKKFLKKSLLKLL